ncbi:MAG TPA: hypothetical protein VIW45_12710 [Vicinamibacterales bacterium]
MRFVIALFVALIGPFAMLSSARRAIETRTIDLVHITPQRAQAIVLGWCGPSAGSTCLRR